MECSGLLLAGISSSFSGSMSESVYGRFREFFFFTVDCSEFVSKSSFFLAFLGFMLEFCLLVALGELSSYLSYSEELTASCLLSSSHL